MKNNKIRSQLGVTLLDDSHNDDNFGERVIFDENYSKSSDDNKSNKVIKKIDEMIMTSNRKISNNCNQNNFIHKPLQGMQFQPSYQFSNSTSTHDQENYNQYFSSFNQLPSYSMQIGYNYPYSSNLIYGIPQQPVYFPNHQSMNYAPLSNYETLYSVHQPISYCSFNNLQNLNTTEKKVKPKKEKSKNEQKNNHVFQAQTKSDNVIINKTRKEDKQILTNKKNSKVNNTDIIVHKLSLIEFIETFPTKKDFIDFICTCKGYRQLQIYIDKVSPNIIDILIDQIGSDFEIIMTNHYANYFFQKLTYNCTSDQRFTILKYIESNFSKIAHNSSGTHALQSLFDIVDKEEQIAMITSCLKISFIDICKVSFYF